MSSNLPQLCTLSGQTVDRKRITPSTYVGGREVKGTSTTTTGIFASVQPPNRKAFEMISQLPEGKRTKVWITVYCELDTFVAADDRNNIPPDTVVYEGDEYEVHLVTHRRGRHLNHDVVLAVRKEA